MGRLFVLGLLMVAVVIAYPWVGVAAAAVIVLVVWWKVRARRNPPAVRPGGFLRLSLDERIARRAAWDDIHAIERGSGLPPTSRDV